MLEGHAGDSRVLIILFELEVLLFHEMDSAFSPALFRAGPSCVLVTCTCTTIMDIAILTPCSRTGSMITIAHSPAVSLLFTLRGRKIKTGKCIWLLAKFRICKAHPILITPIHLFLPRFSVSFAELMSFTYCMSSFHCYLSTTQG
jgi:hypothetical protein